MKKFVFKGSGVAIVTPMKEDGTINYEVMESLIEFQINNSTDAIIVCGTTGESSTLSDEEKIELIKFTVEKVNGRVPVIAGTGGNNTKKSAELSKKAQDIGVDALLLVTPYYNKTSQKGLIEHYNYIASKVNLPIILYNVPSRTGLDISIKTYCELAKNPKIVATKEASGNISKIAEIISSCREDLFVYSGNDDQILPVLSLGGIGVISVFANIFPKESHDIIENYLLGHIAKSREQFFEALPVMNILFDDVNPMPVKKAMKLIGFDCGKCRLPLINISDELSSDIICAILDYKKRKS